MLAFLTLSSAEFCLSNDVHFFCAMWNETLSFTHLICFVLPKGFLSFKKQLSVYTFEMFIFLVPLFNKALEPNIDFSGCGSCISPG